MNEFLRDLEVQKLPVDSLKPYGRNPRTHSAKQIQQIAASIKKFGFTNPILIDENRGVIAGHGRIEAAKLLGFTAVPTIRLEDMTQAQKRAYVLADNKLAENAGWDQELLALELADITKIESEFDLTVTGFETAEIDILLDPARAHRPDKADNLPEIDDSKPTVTRPGDLWILGRHSLLCADATKIESFDRLLHGERADLIFTDPPYNVPIPGNVSGLGSAKHRDFMMASGEMSEAEFTAFLKISFSQLVAHSAVGSIHFIFMDWRHCFEILSAGRETYSELKNLCVWDKNNGGMGSLYRSKHELIFVFKNGDGSHVNNVQLGKYGRNRSNVWSYPGANSLSEDRLEALAMHPTVKPVALVADAILDCSKRGAIVLDSFGGSGTTLIAAERTGRRGRMMDLDPVYVDVTVRRFQKLIGENVIHADTHLTFDETERRCSAHACSAETQNQDEGK